MSDTETNRSALQQAIIDLHSESIRDTGNWVVDSGYEDLFKDAVFVEEQIFDKRRWYNIAFSVYKLKDEYFGVYHVDEVKSEQMSVADCEEELAFTMVEQVMKPAYVPV